jgi:hypothetical protein
LELLLNLIEDADPLCFRLRVPAAAEELDHVIERVAQLLNDL